MKETVLRELKNKGYKYMAKSKLPVNKLSVTAKQVAVNPSPAPSKDYEAQERRYRVEEACRDIERAEKHKADKSLMKDVKAVAKEKIKALGKVL